MGPTSAVKAAEPIPVTIHANPKCSLCYGRGYLTHFNNGERSKDLCGCAYRSAIPEVMGAQANEAAEKMAAQANERVII